MIFVPMSLRMLNSKIRFRWVVYQLASIRTCIKLADLQNALSELPRSLDETYSRILAEIEGKGYLQDALRILQWVCFARRPLSLHEMVDVLAIDLGENGGFDSRGRMPDPHDITEVCSSLITVTSVSHLEGSSEKTDGEVRLAHLSVQEYLQSDHSHLSVEGKLMFSTNLSHTCIAEACLHYLLTLCSEAPLTYDTIQDYRLARYAAEYWWQHASLITAAKSSEQVQGLALRLLTTERMRLLIWVQLFDIDNPLGPNFAMSSNDIADALYYASSINFIEGVEFILHTGCNINAPGGKYGNALQAASARGHEKVVQLLLNADADVRIKGGDFGTALHAASSEGYENIVRQLLSKTVDIDAQDETHATALQAASSAGHEGVVKLLLEYGADINNKGGRFGSALQTASYHGHEKVVKLLLDRRADINAASGRYGSALQAASFKGHERIVQLLLTNGANIDAQDGAYGTALQSASYQGRKEVVQLLLDKSADIKIEGGYYGSALQVASELGHDQVVEVLLKSRAVQEKSFHRSQDHSAPRSGSISSDHQ
jgi:ankyrin repeat protein